MAESHPGESSPSFTKVPFRLTTWNINGIRSAYDSHLEALKHQQKTQNPPSLNEKAIVESSSSSPFDDWLDIHGSDIVCFQEVKSPRGKLDAFMANPERYQAYFSFSKVKAGYSGVATYCRKSCQLAKPLGAEEGLNGLQEYKEIGGYFDPFVAGITQAELTELDSEGRCVITDHGAFVLLNVYFPTAGDTEERYAFKMSFYRAVQARCESLLRLNRRVIIAGDVNCAHQDIDLGDPVKLRSLGGIEAWAQLPHVLWFDQFLSRGGGHFVDLFRRFYPDKTKVFTCWDTRTGARETNTGTRIDYVLVDEGLFEPLEGKTFSTLTPHDCVISPEVQGSDHCPVTAVFLRRDGNSAEVRARIPPLCAALMPEFSGKQQKLSSFFVKQPRNLVSSEKTPSEGFVRKQPSFPSEGSQAQEKKIKISPPEPSDDSSSPVVAAWRFLFTSPVIPKCVHGEDCVEKTVTKGGNNKGKRFFSCARQGSSKCNFFLWSKEVPKMK